MAGFLPGCSFQPKQPPPSTDIDDTAYGDRVRVLASDDFQGRKPGTPGEDKTVGYLIENFRKLGLKPGNGASYVQQVPLLQITAVEAKLSVAGAGGSRDLEFGKDMVIWTKRAVPEINVAHSEMIFVGYGIVAPEYSWNDYANLDVHGKTVVVLANDPGYASKDPAVFKGNAMTEYGREDYKVEEAARQGAQGVLLIHDAALMGYGWNAVKATWSGAQFELQGADTDPDVPRSKAGCRTTRHGRCSRPRGSISTRTVLAAAHPGFKAVPLGLSLDATIHNAIRSFNTQNVLAIWPGRKSHEYVLYTAHWDSLGVDAARAGHNIFNGAVDNATGVAGLLALAQSFKRTIDPVPERSIAFLATTAAEPDLLGSQFYVRESRSCRCGKPLAVINIDMLIDGGPTRDVSILGFGNTRFGRHRRAPKLCCRAARRVPTRTRNSDCISTRTATALRTVACR